MAIRKHKGINQRTGRLNKGYKYSGKTLKSGLKEIKACKGCKKMRGGNPSNLKKVGTSKKQRSVTWDERITVVGINKNDCPTQDRVKSQIVTDPKDGNVSKIWLCPNKRSEYITENGIRCCKRGRFSVMKK